ncbi:MAG TPA: S8 family serine peptidase, partial [Opitutaceae bacterium]
MGATSHGGQTPQATHSMKKVLPNRPGRVFAVLGFFVVAATLGWSGEKRVWVQYQSGAKGPVMAALAQAGGRVHYEFDNLGAVAVSLPEQSLAGLSRNPNVALIEDDPIRVMLSQTVPYGIDAVQATNVWDADNNGTVDAGAPTGTDIIVGVVDSGVYKLHEDFAGVTINGESGVSGSAYDRDWFGHGTHVTGTIAAANNSLGVVGVAPGIGGIYMVKVFGDNGAWAYSSDLLHAVQRAVNPGGARIVSMSLGGSFKSRTEETGLNKIYNNGNGVLLVAAAGNDGSTRTSYPAGYSSVISVAAIDESMTVADFSQKNSTVELAAPGVAVLSTVPYLETNTVTVGSSTSYSGNHIEFAARGSATAALVNGGLGDTPNSAWSGKVVLVQRGSISFYDKVHNVQTEGGVACVIYNNEPGNFLGTLGDGNSSTIPAISVSDTDGTALLSVMESNATVLSSVEQPGSGYEAWDGTSMATPHVSGVAALVWSAFPTATAGQIRQALDSSALDLAPAGRDNATGYGLVQAKAAIDLLGGSPPPPPPPGDGTPPGITNVNFAPAKGKPGTFA